MGPVARTVMPLRVRYAECDMQGRVFNAHYLTWTDMAHTEALREHVGGYREMLDGGVDLVVAAAELTYRAPATFDDDLTVTVEIGQPGRTSLRSHFTIERGPDLIAQAVMVHVCVDATTYAKREWPDWFRERLAAGSHS